MIREMVSGDWARVAAIYTQGIACGIATFTTECPTWEEWDRDHLPDCRFVYELDGTVAGWVALSPTSAREAYRGCVEMSVYIDTAYHRRGIASALIRHLIDAAQEAGYWCLYSAVISINAPSIALHRQMGFREFGFRERIAKDIYGNWQNTTLFELRLEDKDETR